MYIRRVRNVRFSDVFRGIKKDYWEEKGLKNFAINVVQKQVYQNITIFLESWWSAW